MKNNRLSIYQTLFDKPKVNQDLFNALNKKVTHSLDINAFDAWKEFSQTLTTLQHAPVPPENGKHQLTTSFNKLRDAVNNIDAELLSRSSQEDLAAAKMKMDSFLQDLSR